MSNKITQKITKEGLVEEFARISYALGTVIGYNHACKAISQRSSLSFTDNNDPDVSSLERDVLSIQRQFMELLLSDAEIDQGHAADLVSRKEKLSDMLSRYPRKTFIGVH